MMYIYVGVGGLEDHNTTVSNQDLDDVRNWEENRLMSNVCGMYGMYGMCGVCGVCGVYGMYGIMACMVCMR